MSRRKKIEWPDESDWIEVFKASVEKADPGDDVSLAAVRREDVVQIVGIDGGSEEGYGEWSGAMIGRLKDGRYVAAHGWCDTTGWGCQDGAYVGVASTRRKAVVFGLDAKARARLGFDDKGRKLK